VGRRAVVALVGVAAAAGLIATARVLLRGPRPAAAVPERTAAPVGARSRFASFDRFGFWYGGVSPAVRVRSLDTGDYSNIEPEDYAPGGAAACAECHREQYRGWSNHPHRWMNAALNPDRVRGDFSGTTKLPYLGGTGRFWRDGDRFHMAAERGPVRRTFRVTRTVGSRYFEYYVGVQTAGPEPADDDRYRVEHVLPFGFWLTRRQWVPTVHIREDRADDADDPRLNPYEDFYFRGYDDICARCHTTLAAGDWLIRTPIEAGRMSPHKFSLDLTGYLQRQRPGLLPDDPRAVSSADLGRVVEELVENRPPARILHLGVQCEACHNGCKQHAGNPERRPPHFFPTSPLVHAELPRDNPHGRTHANLNWVCSRCHVGPRPQFPGGLSTWNSTEYTDAVRGACYSQLRCVDCHEPHTPTGPTWPHSADHDDRSCLRCHEGYRDAKARQAHTRHAPGSDGDRCMNCHMPRVNEGLDTVVRTHTIFSPTKAASIEQNGPNACNLCHLDRPIDWTLGHLRDWYGKTYNEAEIDRHHASRREPLGHVWLRHPFRATRLVAAAAYGRQRDPTCLPVLLGILDDNYLLNRQFGQLAVEAVSGRSLDTLGYSFTLSPEERAAVLPRIRATLTPARK
jgi:hypothetical protein